MWKELLTAIKCNSFTDSIRLFLLFSMYFYKFSFLNLAVPIILTVSLTPGKHNIRLNAAAAATYTHSSDNRANDGLCVNWSAWRDCRAVSVPRLINSRSERLKLFTRTASWEETCVFNSRAGASDPLMKSWTNTGKSHNLQFSESTNKCYTVIKNKKQRWLKYT